MTAGLFLNCYAVKLSGSRFTLPCRLFDDASQRDAALRELDSGTRVCRWSPTDREHALVYVSGEKPLRTPLERGANVADNAALYAAILQSLVVKELVRSGECWAINRKTDVQVVKKTPSLKIGAFRAYPGVGLSVYRPFRENPEQFYVRLIYRIRTEFEENLDSHEMQRVAIGMPVIASRHISIEGRYIKPGQRIGIVEDIKDSRAHVQTKGGGVESFGLESLRLDSRPEVVSAYEKDRRLRSGEEDRIWLEVLHQRFDLNENYKRSPRALRDKMHAARRFVFGEIPSDIFLNSGLIDGFEPIVSCKPEKVIVE